MGKVNGEEALSWASPEFAQEIPGVTITYVDMPAEGDEADRRQASSAPWNPVKAAS